MKKVNYKVSILAGIVAFSVFVPVFNAPILADEEVVLEPTSEESVEVETADQEEVVQDSNESSEPVIDEAEQDEEVSDIRTEAQSLLDQATEFQTSYGDCLSPSAQAQYVDVFNQLSRALESGNDQDIIDALTKFAHFFETVEFDSNEVTEHTYLQPTVAQGVQTGLVSNVNAWTSLMALSAMAGAILLKKKDSFKLIFG